MGTLTVRTLAVGTAPRETGARGDDVRGRGTRTAERAPVDRFHLLPESLRDQKLADSGLIRAPGQRRPRPLTAAGIQSGT
jgi:hypothetical protein